MTAKSAAVALALMLGAVWAGCGDDGPTRCDEALGYVCQKGATGAGGSTSGVGSAPLMGAGGAGTVGLGGSGSGGQGPSTVPSVSPDIAL